MPFADPGDAVSGATVPATWGDDVRASLLFHQNPPACRVFHSAAQSIAHATIQQVAFDSETFDTAGMHSTSADTGRITFGTAGVYVVSFSGNLANGTDYTHVVARIRLNSTTTIASVNLGPHTDATTQPDVTVTTIYKVAAADWVDAVIFQENGAAAARNLERNASYSAEFSAVWVGAG